MSWLTRVGVLLLLSVSACVAQEWHFVHSPLCGLLKVKGASVSNQSSPYTRPRRLTNVARDCQLNLKAVQIASVISKLWIFRRDAISQFSISKVDNSSHH